MLHRGFMICSSYRTLYFEIVKSKQIFWSNGCTKNFVDRCIKMYLDKVFIKHQIICTVPFVLCQICEKVRVFQFPSKKLLEIKKQLQNSTERKWLWVGISLLSRKFQIWRLLRARSSLTFRQTIECRFTLKIVRQMIITYSLIITW